MALGRTKTGRRQRAESNAAKEEAAEPDQELESYLAALTPEESVESTGSGRRFGASDVYQLRLPLMANEQLKELAARQGTSPASLAREWVLQHLADLSPGSPDWPEREAAAPGRDSGQDLHAVPGSRHAAAPDAIQDQLAPQVAPAGETDTELTIPHEQFTGGAASGPADPYGQGGQFPQVDPHGQADPYGQSSRFPRGGDRFPQGNQPPEDGQYPTYPRDSYGQTPSSQADPYGQVDPYGQPDPYGQDSRFPQGGGQPLQNGQVPQGGQIPQGDQYPDYPDYPEYPQADPYAQYQGRQSAPGGLFQPDGQPPHGDYYSPDQDPYAPQYYR